MVNKTIEQEIPVTKEGLLFYRKGLEKELDKHEKMIKRISSVLKKVNDYIEKMK